MAIVTPVKTWYRHRGFYPTNRELFMKSHYSTSLQKQSTLLASGADIGFAQVDLLTDPGLSGDANIRQLWAPMPTQANLLHVVTLKRGTRAL